MNPHGIWVITAHSFKESIRSRWLQIFALAYFMVAINVPILVLLALHLLPVGYLSTYLTSTIALSFQFIPLLALPMGATSIVDEREMGTLQYVMSNPLTKEEFFVGRALGLLIATSGVVLLGFGVASIIAHAANYVAYGPVASVLVVAGGLNMMMLMVALVVSTVTKRKSTALGIAIFIWLAITVVTTLGVLTYALDLGPGPAVIAILADPVEMTRILAVLYLGGGGSQLGATGLVVAYQLGSQTIPILWGVLAAYIAAFFAAAFILFRTKDLT